MGLRFIIRNNSVWSFGRTTCVGVFPDENWRDLGLSQAGDQIFGGELNVMGAGPSSI
jgi:hypothetical protein